MRAIYWHGKYTSLAWPNMLFRLRPGAHPVREREGRRACVWLEQTGLRRSCCSEEQEGSVDAAAPLPTLTRCTTAQTPLVLVKGTAIVTAHQPFEQSECESTPVVIPGMGEIASVASGANFNLARDQEVRVQMHKRHTSVDSMRNE